LQRGLTPRRRGHLEVPAPAADQGRLPPYRRVPVVARVNLVAGVHLLPPPRRHCAPAKEARLHPTHPCHNRPRRPRRPHFTLPHPTLRNFQPPSFLLLSFYVSLDLICSILGLFSEKKQP